MATYIGPILLVQETDAVVRQRQLQNTKYFQSAHLTFAVEFQ